MEHGAQGEMHGRRDGVGRFGCLDWSGDDRLTECAISTEQLYRRDPLAPLKGDLTLLTAAWTLFVTETGEITQGCVLCCGKGRGGHTGLRRVLRQGGKGTREDRQGNSVPFQGRGRGLGRGRLDKH